MAKGKSNPKTVERVKGMTKAMRNEMEQAEAEAAAQAAAAKAAKERRKGRGRGHVSSDEDEPDTLPDVAAAAGAKPKGKVQIGGFGIGCRGTGNEKARRLKEEHDAQTRKKKAARLQRQAEAAAAPPRDDGDDDDESWRVRNPTVNKKANRGKKTRGGKATGRRDDDDDDDDDIGLVSALADLPEPDEADEADETGGPGAIAGGGGGAARQPAGASSAFALLMGDEDDDEEEEEDEDDDEDDAREGAESRPAPGGFAALLGEEDEDENEDALGGALAGLELEDGSMDPDAIPSLAELEAMEGDEEGGATEGSDPTLDVSSAPDPDPDPDPDPEPDPVPESPESESEWETDEDEDEDAPWDPRPCESLFDGHESESVEANETYMRVKHGFVIPYRDNLADVAGLLSHLQRKIYRRRQCVWCSRKFSTLEGVRGHMRDAGHVKIKFEPPAVYRGNPLFADVPELDDYVPELSEFYDFPTDADAVVTAATFDSHLGGLELVLGSGKQLGHRSYRRYYRQKFRNDYVAKGSKSDERRAGQVAVATRLATRERNKQANAVATRSMRLARGGASKALAAQYTHKAGFADNAARRAIVHHWGAGGGGSHYHTAGSKQFLKGVRIKGVVSRHSKQGARLGAARVQAARNKANRGNASVAVLRSSTRKG